MGSIEKLYNENKKLKKQIEQLIKMTNREKKKYESKMKILAISYLGLVLSLILIFLFN